MFTSDHASTSPCTTTRNATTEPIHVDTSDLPSAEECTFENTKKALPTPADVRIKAKQDNNDQPGSFRPAPVRYPEMNLIVKWGKDVTVAEGQCLWFLQKHLPVEVPSPKVFGWRRDAGQTFLYMQLVEGDQLADRWDGLTEEEKNAVCGQLREAVSHWRRLRQPIRQHNLSCRQRLFSGICCMLGCNSAMGSPKLCHIGGQALRDIMFSDVGKYPAGPFAGVGEFHDWFAKLASRTSTHPRQEIPELSGLTDDVDIVFTHNDLDLSNILVSKTGDGPLRVVAIVDWHQSGWYPEPWEWLKARCVAVPRSDWQTTYLSRALDPAEHGYYLAWEYISMATI